LKRKFAPVDSSKFSKLGDELVKVGVNEIAPILIVPGTGTWLGGITLNVVCWLFRRKRRSPERRHPPTNDTATNNPEFVVALQ